MEISQNDFWNYVDLQKEGCINMFDIKGVMEITGLPKDKIINIMKNYKDLKMKYGEDNTPSCPT